LRIELGWVRLELVRNIGRRDNVRKNLGLLQRERLGNNWIESLRLRIKSGL
jgi:hypothetical protein